MKDISEQKLKDIGLGYRAKYIVDSVKMMNEYGGNKYFLDLRKKEFKEIRSELMQFKGVGSKVADCVALFSLDCKGCIPVDTHVFQIYHKTYGQKELKMNKENYEKIVQFFQNKFGEHAGWAHSYLFTADLPIFNQILNENVKKISGKFGDREEDKQEEDIIKKKKKKK